MVHRPRGEVRKDAPEGAGGRDAAIWRGVEHMALAGHWPALAGLTLDRPHTPGGRALGQATLWLASAWAPTVCHVICWQAPGGAGRWLGVEGCDLRRCGAVRMVLHGSRSSRYSWAVGRETRSARQVSEVREDALEGLGRWAT